MNDETLITSEELEDLDVKLNLIRSLAISVSEYISIIKDDSEFYKDVDIQDRHKWISYDLSLVIRNRIDDIRNDISKLLDRCGEVEYGRISAENVA